jgi:UDP-glucose 4-epimerase
MDWEGKKVLVTGTSGFIGSNLTKKLLVDGAEVFGIDNFSYIDADMAKRKLFDTLKQTRTIGGDVSEKETWKHVPKDIEYIFHFAGPSSITLFKENPEKCYTETLFGLKNTLEFAKDNESVKKVIYPSTGSLYAGNEFPHNEKIYPLPKNLYAAAKMACEGLASSYSDFVKSIGLRIFAGYGPGEEWKKDFGSVLYLFIRDQMNGVSPVVWGNGQQTRDFVYIDDLTKIIMQAAEKNVTGVVNIGTGKATSFSKLLEIINETLGTEVKPTYIPKERNYVDNLKADTRIMKRVFEIEPTLPEEGIKKFIEYLKSQNEILGKRNLG